MPAQIAGVARRRLERDDPSAFSYENRCQQRVEPNVRADVEKHPPWSEDLGKQALCGGFVRPDPASVGVRADDPAATGKRSRQDWKDSALRQQLQRKADELPDGS